jgi:tetratricopeptide (TPR) repeat protein
MKSKHINIFLLFVAVSLIYSYSYAQTTPDSVKIRTYPHLAPCIENIYMESDSIRAEAGPSKEIDWLRMNRTICTNNSAVTRRLSLRLMELGDGQYGDEGLEIAVNKKELFIESLKWARVAIKEDSTDDINYENISMAFAARITVAGLKGKSMLADSVRIYAEKAIQINPANHRAYHILGRWHYEVSKLSWVVKKLSKLVFRHSPSGSFNLAVEYFNKAIALNNIPVHHYWLGMSYLESGREEEALARFRYLLEIKDDGRYNASYFKEKAKEVLEKYG